MTRELQIYEGAAPMEPSDAGGLPVPDAAGQPLATMWGVLRRRWKIILAAWLLLAIPAVCGVLLIVEPTFTATANIQITPVIPKILYEDEDTRQPIPLFDTYLNTQAQLVASPQVLTAALADPGVQDLPLLKEKDPVTVLRKQLVVETVPRTYLVRVGVAQRDPEPSVRLTRAVVDAYMLRVVGADLDKERTKREVLEKTREDLRRELNRLSEEIRRLAERYGAATETTFDELRKNHEELVLESRKELERAELEVNRLEQQLARLEQGAVAGLIPEETAIQRQQAIENDPGVQSLRRQLDQLLGRLHSIRARLSDSHVEVVTTREQIAALQKELEQERHRAAADADKAMEGTRKQLAEDARRRLRDSLETARQQRDLLKKRVQEADTRGLAIGQHGLAIQSLREQREAAKQEYDRVADALRQLEIESRRPARVSVAAMPEVRPDGVKDRRLRLAVLALLGPIALAVALAYLRDRLDPHVQDTEQIEAGMGLRLLGAVPSLKELQAGRVTRQDFVESYRVIRTALAGMTVGERAIKSILVTSAQAGEGKTSLAVSLAISLAEAGSRVLLIDGDVQAPQISRLLKLNPPHDLKDALHARERTANCITASGFPSLDVLALNNNGEVSSSALNIRSAARVIGEVTPDYDCIIVDSPPALGAADALVWAHVTDGVILSSLLGQSDRTAISLVRQRLGSVGGHLLGVVLANVSHAETFYSYSTTSVSREPRGAGQEAPVARRPALIVQLPENDAKPPATDPPAR